MSIATEQIVHDFFAKLDAWRLDEAYALCSEDFAFIPPGADKPLTRQEHRERMYDLKAAFGDYGHKVVEQFSGGDRVATRFFFSGIHHGTYKGLAPTGKRLTTTAIALDRVVNGRITERYVELDFLGMLLRAGAKVAAP